MPSAQCRRPAATHPRCLRGSAPQLAGVQWPESNRRPALRRPCPEPPGSGYRSPRCDGAWRCVTTPHPKSSARRFAVHGRGRKAPGRSFSVACQCPVSRPRQQNRASDGLRPAEAGASLDTTATPRHNSASCQCRDSELVLASLPLGECQVGSPISGLRVPLRNPLRSRRPHEPTSGAEGAGIGGGSGVPSLARKGPEPHTSPPSSGRNGS